jgi:hypothetical protein
MHWVALLAVESWPGFQRFDFVLPSCAEQRMAKKNKKNNTTKLQFRMVKTFHC